MGTTKRIVAASIFALVLPWAATGTADARPPKLDLSQFELCLSKPSKLDKYGHPESTYAKRKRCCESAGGTLVFSTQGPPNCVQAGAEAPRVVTTVPPVGVFTPA